MKVIYYVAASIAVAGSLGAQTNVFNSTGNVGIGTTSPGTSLVVDSNSNTGTMEATVQLRGAANKERFEILSSGSGTSVFMGRYVGGTYWAPTRTPSNVSLVWLLGGGFDGASWTNTAGIQAVSEQAFYPTAKGTSLRFHVTPNDSNTRFEALRITPSGNVGIGTTGPGAKFHVRGATAGEFTALQLDNSQGGLYSTAINLYVNDGTQYRGGRIVTSIVGAGWTDSFMTLQSQLSGGLTITLYLSGAVTSVSAPQIPESN